MTKSVGAWKARRHGLPDVDVARDDDAVDGAADPGEGQVGGRRRGRLGLEHGGLGRGDAAALPSRVAMAVSSIRLRDQARTAQSSCWRGDAPGVVVGGVAPSVTLAGPTASDRVRFLELRLEEARIQRGEQLALLHRAVEVDVKLVDDPRNLGPALR